MLGSHSVVLVFVAIDTVITSDYVAGWLASSIDAGCSEMMMGTIVITTIFCCRLPVLPAYCLCSL